MRSVNAYRKSMQEFAEMRTMDVWHSRLSAERDHAGREERGEEQERRKEKKGGEKAIAKARTRDSLQALSKLGEMVDGRYRIVSQPPIVVPMRELAAYYSVSPDEIEQAIHDSSAGTAPRSRTIGVTCWSGSRSSTWRGRSSVSAASARARSSSCSKVATSRIRSSSRSRRRRPRCWRTTFRAVVTSSTASAWCRANA